MQDPRRRSRSVVWSLVVGAALALALVLVPAPAPAQGSMDDVEVEATRVRGPIWMITGRGGNLAAVLDERETFLVDDQYAPLTDRIVRAIRDAGGGPVRLVVNTHWHGDHTGGNENLGRAGAVILAHDHVRERMSTEQHMEAFDRRVPASPPAALPVVTYADGVTVHLGGETARVIHVPRAHTDGDSMVWFVDSDVLHTGDVVFNGTYPFIDVSSGGSVRGLIDAVDRALDIVGPATRIVPGHGPLADREDLVAYRTMLVDVADRVEALIAEGRDLEGVHEARPTAKHDEAWGGGFMDADTFVGLVYESLKR